MWGIYDSSPLLWNNSAMKVAILLGALSLSWPAAALAQTPAPPASAAVDRDKVGEAYEQFLLAHRAEQQNDVDAAIAAYKRAGELDPASADVLAELSSLYLRQNRTQEAMSTAERALAIEPDDREANRVLGTIYAAMIDSANSDTSAQAANSKAENLDKAIRYLEIAIDHPIGEPNPNTLATLGRLYVAAGMYDKAIPLLTDLVSREPGWQEGTLLLVNAFVGAGRNGDAITWLEPLVPDDPRLLSTLAELYERQQRWKDAADTYAVAVERTPRNTELKTRYSAALMTLGGRADVAKARDLLTEVVSARDTDARALFLLSQAQRRLGDAAAAEKSARRLIMLQAGLSPWGYHVLAEALEQRGDYQGVVTALTPAITSFRGRGEDATELALLLPHVGFAQMELGAYEPAIAALDEAHRLAPTDSAIASNLIEANIAAKRYSTAVTLAREARDTRPGDWQFARLQAQALRQDGKGDQGVALLEVVLKQHADQPGAFVALAQMYSDVNRGSQAVKLLQDAETKFPADTSIVFELGAVLEKQKKYSDAEAAFRKVIAREPDHAAALNYLGYMLADRGERLDESVGYLTKALQFEPDNGSFLDSLGWAYFKQNKLDLAEANLHRAADQLVTNSVIQEHYGEVLFKLGRFDDAAAAWTRALAGDGDSIDRGSIEKKIRSAKQKLNKK
jgi:tetratricopeptide (TPR) repeat protein